MSSTNKQQNSYSRNFAYKQSLSESVTNNKKGVSPKQGAEFSISPGKQRVPSSLMAQSKNNEPSSVIDAIGNMS